MAFVVGEVELSPTSISKLSSQTKQLIPTSGTRYVLLDSVRDSTFLSSSSIVNPDGSHDGGLGIVDNGLFLYTSAVNPSTKGARQYPVKFFWIGSPAGTNDVNDNFSIYVADVNQSAFYPGAPAGAWLLNPRLVLHWSQAKTDITNWFDGNYPGGATNGVGNSNSGSNSTYGVLAGGNSTPGNISGMDSLDGQFWPIYDYVDNSILLYFSIKTPNQNTLSIYCYKLTDTEMSSPASSSEFLGGVYSQNWRYDATVTSSHRFSLISPDPLVVQGRVKGQQSAVGFYAFGTFDGATPDHARYMVGFILTDIHGSPLNWNTPYQVSAQAGIDLFGMYNVDKLGSIQAISGGDNHVQASYACLYNATSDRDIRQGSNSVVISAMQVRVCYYHPAAGAITFGSDAIVPQGQVNAIGHCRPQFSYLPDGIPKIVYATFTFDQYLNIGYEYFPSDALSPNRHRVLSQTYDSFPSPVTVPTYGRRKMRILVNTGGAYASPNPQNIQTASQITEIFNLSSTTGPLPYSTFNDPGTLLLHTQGSPYDYNGTPDFGKIADASLEGIRAPYLRIKPIGGGTSTYVYGIVNLED